MLEPERNDLHKLIERASHLIDTRPIEAFQLAVQAQAMAEQLGDRAVRARALYLSGGSLVATAEYRRAEIALTEALQQARLCADGPLVISCLRMLLRSAFLTRNLDVALVRGLQALHLARESGDEQSEALAHNDLGLIYGNVGDLEDALEHLLAGLRIMRECGSPKLSSLLSNIGNVYLEVGDAGEARAFFREALKAATNEESWRGEAIALGNIGRALLDLGDLAGAIESNAASVALYRNHADAVYLGPALARSANALAEVGRDAEAREMLREAFETLERLPHREFGDEIYLSAGSFHLSRHEVDRALPLLTRALELVPADETTRRMDRLHAALADAYEALGDPARALRHFKEHHRIRQALSDSSIAVRIRGLMLQFDVERARRQEEIIRKQNVELARANAELQELQGALEARNRELHRISIEDSLTGLYNRRYLDLQLGVEISRAQRHQRPLCAAMCDIDHFKDINDRYSHAIGDEVLRRIGGIVRDTARLTDVVSRYGGEEFLLILPDTELEGAEAVAERLRALVAEYPWSEIGQGLRVTFSIGVAELAPAMGADGLLAAADARLYEAKRGGRDRVVA